MLIIFFLYNFIMLILLNRNFYLPVFKYITVIVHVTIVIMMVYLYSYASGWAHSLRTISLSILFAVIALSGFYQKPSIPVFTSILASIEYTVYFIFVYFFTDIEIAKMETFYKPAISFDILFSYIMLFFITGIIVSYITHRNRIVLERSLHFEAEAFLKKEIEKANEKLKEMDRFKTTFFQNITHELRTPLTLILGPLEGILDSNLYDNISEALRTKLMIIKKNAQRLLLLVNQLLDLSKIEERKMKLKTCETEIIGFCRKISATYHSYAEKRKISLQVVTEADKINIYIDQEKMEKVIHNLLSNAFKFVKDEGEITISILSPAFVPKKPDNMDLHKSGTFQAVLIKIRDNGTGIPANALPHIFNRFQQVDDSSTREHEGTGIGLSIVKEYVELHHGWTEVRSELHNFTEFLVALPYDKAHLKPEEILEDANINYKHEYNGKYLFDMDYDTKEEAVEQKPNTAGYDCSLKKVLIVEDNIDMRKYTKDILIQNYRIFEAQNGEEGLKLAKEILPDLILSDVMMPKMDGSQLLKALKTNETTAKIPVIILTAQASEDYMIDKLEKGADDYLSKPFNPRELLARVKIILKAREYEKIILDKNKKIIDSINYAKRIQLSILPDEALLNKSLSRYFVIWKPRDIVGGDFYWFHRIDDKKYLVAVIDCTGHGVPGAVMTMTANSVLKRITDHLVKDDPAEILKYLNIITRETLKQNVQNPISNDGMDISLCYINITENKLLFSGARHSIFYSAGDSIKEISGDKQSIGYIKSKENYKYTNHELKLEKSMVFYLASDGYYEQDSPENNFIMGKTKFKEILSSCSRLPIAKQIDFLNNKLEEFQRDKPQRDDITVLGFKI